MFVFQSSYKLPQLILTQFQKPGFVPHGYSRCSSYEPVWLKRLIFFLPVSSMNFKPLDSPFLSQFLYHCPPRSPRAALPAHRPPGHVLLVPLHVALTICLTNTT